MDETQPPSPAPQPEAAPIKIAEVDRWRLSHLNLELRYIEQARENLELRRELLERDKLTTVQRYQAEVGRLCVAHGIDPNKHRITSDGTVLPSDHPFFQKARRG